MEQLEGRRLKIVGQAPDGNRSTIERPLDQKQLAERECLLSKYFDTVMYQDTTPAAGKPFSAHTVFIGCLAISDAPRKTVVDTVNLNGSYYNSSRGRGSNMFSFQAPIPWASRRREEIVLFKFDEKPFNRAYFYKVSKTLVTGTLLSSRNGIAYLKLIIDYLLAHNLISRRAEAEVSQIEEPATTKKGIEFHAGQRVFVNLPLNRRTVTVGCDPEFEWLNDSGRPATPPSRFNGCASNIELGKDGAGDQIEVRPKPFEKPSDVVSYMITIFKRIEGEKLSAKGDAYPLGGHIHVGVGAGWNAPRDLRWLLDYYLGKPTINLSGSARGHYRTFAADNTDACRVQNWGFEHRTCPASIFSNPEFARLALKIAKNVTECYINGQTMIVNEVPTFEDYWNYAGLTPREYERWIALISEFTSFMGSGRPYQVNMLDAWLSNEAIAQFPSQINAEQFARLETESTRRVAAREAERNQSAEEARLEQERIARTLRDRARATELNRATPRMISFNDDWTPEVATVFRTVIERELPAAQFPAFNIHLFGLSETRGNTTFGYTVEGIPSCVEPNTGWSGFGVSRVVRMTGVGVAEFHAMSIARTYRASLTVQPTASVPAVSILDDEGVTETESAVAEAIDWIRARVHAPARVRRARNAIVSLDNRPVSITEAIDQIMAENP